MAKEAEQKMRSADKAITGMKKQSIGYQLYRNRWLYLMLLLPIVYFAVFKFGPIYGLQIAFRNFRVRKGIWGSEWVYTTTEYFINGNGREWAEIDGFG